MLREDGSYIPGTNPWVECLLADVLALATVSDSELLQAVGDCPLQLFQDEDIKDVFMRSDVHVLQAAQHSVTVLVPGTVVPTDSHSAELGSLDAVFRCPVLDQQGVQCQDH